MSLDDLTHARCELAKAVEALGLPITIRSPDNWAAIDDSVFYAKSASRELFVGIAEDVSWGPDICSYVDEPHEYRSVPIMNISVPNSLAGKTGSVVEYIRAWFDQ